MLMFLLKHQTTGSHIFMGFPCQVKESIMIYIHILAGVQTVMILGKNEHPGIEDSLKIRISQVFPDCILLIYRICLIRRQFRNMIGNAHIIDILGDTAYIRIA